MSEKRKSNLWSEMLKPVVVLTVICIVVSALLALTNGITAPIIEQKKLEAAMATRKELLPDATGFTELETTVEGVESVHADDGGSGYVIVVNGKGYKGDLPVTVALSPEGEILGIKVDASGETAGVGSKVGEASYLAQYIGLGKQQSDGISSATQNEDGSAAIDILSGATVSSKAVYNAVGLAFEAYEQVKGA